jgi:thiol-disulfide isomerase/thioredoxin
MRKLSILFASVILLFGCNKTPTNQATLSGTIKAENLDSIKISYYENDYLEEPVIKTVGLDEKNSFSVDLEPRDLKNYELRLLPKQKKEFIMKPGWNTSVFVEMTSDNSIDTIYFEGKGGKENQVYSDFNELSYKAYDYIKEKPQRFIEVLDSIENEMNKLVSQTELDKDFKKMMNNDIYYNKLMRWNSYKRYAQRSGKKLDTLYVNEFEEKLNSRIELNDPSLLSSSFFRGFLEDTLRKAAQNNMDMAKLREKYQSQKELYNAYMKIRVREMFNAADSLIHQPDIKAYAYYHTMLRNLNLKALEAVKEIYGNRFKQVVKDEYKHNVVEDKIAKLEKLTPGNPAPEFSYPNKEGEMVSLQDLEGKHVYLDIWATWCGPCVREIPKLKELHEKYGEEIAFVSVSVDPQKEKWENFLKARELEGYQLYSGKNFESEIISDYMVQGIPRFVMIDPEGKIINVDAPRPSSKETEKIMKKWINSEG